MVEASEPTYDVPMDIKKNFNPAEISELIRVFKFYDTDKNETMDKKEFKQVCIDLGHRDITDEQVQTMLNEVDLNSDGVICFSEFLLMFSKLKNKNEKLFTQVVSSKAGDMNQNVDGSGFTHSYLVEEKEVFARALNHHLEGDKDVAHYLPVNIENDDFFFILSDGIILCKLVNLVQENTIDMRAVNMK